MHTFVAARFQQRRKRISLEMNRIDISNEDEFHSIEFVIIEDKPFAQNWNGKFELLLLQHFIERRKN